MRAARRGWRALVPGAPGTVGDTSNEVEPSDDGLDPDARARFEAASDALEGHPPMPEDEARAVLERITPAGGADQLTADRAEALAQLRAALGALAPFEARKPAREPLPGVDPGALRQAAHDAVTGAEELRRAESALASLTPVDQRALEVAREALSEAEAAHQDMDPARRRVVGALISAVGMGIIVATMGWPAWVYLLPAQLVLIMTADLRVAGAALRTNRHRANERMAAAGVADAAALEQACAGVGGWEAANRRALEARRRRDETWARWEELAPEKHPGEVEYVIQRLTQPVPATPPPAPDDPHTARARALAEGLLDEARRDLARVDAALRDLAKVLRARRALEWHEARAALGIKDENLC